MPYIINNANGEPTRGLKVLPDEIFNNFFVAGGGANSGASDNDDGSSFYNIHHNVFIYGGESLKCRRNKIKRHKIYPQ